MANPWFRMYSEFATDPKVQMLGEADQRRFVMLLCLRCSNGDVTLHDEEVAFQLRISNEQWAATKAVLVAKGLISEGNQPSAWERRQYTSDTSAARVAAHRQRKKEACNVTVTPPDTDTDTDTEGAKAPTPVVPKTKPAKTDPKTDPRFEQFWRVYPNRKAKAKAETAWLKLNPSNELFETLMAALAAQSLSPDWVKDEGQFVPHPATWINQRRWEDEVNHASSPQPGRSGTVSEVDKVRLAIEAREAAAATAGQAVAENGRDLRPALDGEFRRVG